MEILTYDDMTNPEGNEKFALYDDYSDMEECPYGGEGKQYRHGAYEPYYDESVYPDALSETVRKKRVVRQGKRVVKKVTDKPGYRIQNGREVRMSTSEKRKRAISQRKAARKRKPQQKAAERKRKRSIRKR